MRLLALDVPLGAMKPADNFSMRQTFGAGDKLYVNESPGPDIHPSVGLRF
jgi:hypothetical protein